MSQECNICVKGVTHGETYANLVECEERTSKSAETKHGQSSALFLILKAYSMDFGT
jgi:hypothetical protein